jgi:metal-responsive CopG/Arc/MetJ family transcriptional regulator
MTSTTIGVTLSAELLDRLDDPCRSTDATRDEVIGEALMHHLGSARQAETDRQIIDAYRRRPTAESSAAEASARALIAEEPW